MGMIKTRVTSKEEAIHKAALSDPDAQPLTEYELALFRPFIFLKNRLKS